MTSKLDPVLMSAALERSGRALQKIARFGRRGATLISLEEIEAMAIVLADFTQIIINLPPDESGRDPADGEPDGTHEL